MKKIKNVCSRFSSGNFISAEKISDSGKFPVYGGNGLRGYTENFNFDGECAIIGRQGAYCGNVKFFSGKGHMTEHAIVAVANEENFTKFLYYKFCLMNFGKYASQSAQPGLSAEFISNLEIDLPPLEVQKQIGNFLYSLDQKISLNKKINATLEDMAKTIYDYYFVQFDFPDENGKPYKSSGGKMIFSPELQREIPEGWQVGNLNLIADIIAGGDRPDEISNFKTKEFSIPIYSNSTEKQGLYGFSKNSSIKKDSITIAARGNIGYAVLRKKNFLPIIRLIVITPNENIYLEYIYHFFKNYSYCKNGSVQQQLTVPQVKEINLVIPPTNILRKYHNFVDSNIKKQFQILEENNLLVNLRDFLLPMLMNGQVTFAEE